MVLEGAYSLVNEGLSTQVIVASFPYKITYKIRIIPVLQVITGILNLQKESTLKKMMDSFCK